MAEGMTTTGRAEMKEAIEQFPARQTAALKAVASATATRVLARARANLEAKTKGQGNTAAALQITEDLPNKQYIVHFGLIKGRPANLPIWLEYGTVRMSARPFMRPAAEAEDARYRSDMAAASERAARDVFGD